MRLVCLNEIRKSEVHHDRCCVTVGHRGGLGCTGPRCTLPASKSFERDTRTRAGWATSLHACDSMGDVVLPDGFGALHSRLCKTESVRSKS
eukprot:720304-Rhodomonas_salina.3